MTRLQATVALLQAWLDYFPDPPTWTGELQRRAVPANTDPKHLGYVACDQCHGEGCRACRFKGRFVGDPYLAERGLMPETAMSYARFVNCPTCGGWGRLSADSNARPSNDHPVCDKCLGTGRVPGLAGGILRVELGDGTVRDRTEDATLDALALGHERRDTLGIYVELKHGLDLMKAADPHGHLLVEWVWVMGAQSPESLPLQGLVRLVNATRTLEAGLPDRFEKKLPGEVRAQVEHRLAMRSRWNGWAQAKGRGVSEKQARRDAEIARLYESGNWSQDALARKFGLGQQAVSKIVRRVA